MTSVASVTSAAALAALGCCLTGSAPAQQGATVPAPVTAQVPTPPSPGAKQAVLAPSRLVEAAGRVEVATSAGAPWRAATNGVELPVGARVRTLDRSRAAVQFSDRSVLRLGENTVLEIQPPRAAEQRRFRLPAGSIFFFNRERPASVEFETPVASGAIRGTEFVLSAAAANGATRLALLDGAVNLTAAGATVSLQPGEQAQVEPGAAPLKSPLLDLPALLQWAVYYPAVVNPDDLALDDDARARLAPALAAYRSGDLLAAHAALSAPPAAEPSPGGRVFRAAVELAVGGVDAAEAWLNPGGAEAAATLARTPGARALREMMAVARGQRPPGATNAPEDAWPAPGDTAGEWLARSYALQSAHRLAAARDAAERAVRLAPDFAYARVRLAELELGFENRRSALEALDRALAAAPRLAAGHALRGFALLDANQPRPALAAFDRAIELDAALGNAWLGRGLAQLRLRARAEALRSFQTAAALEPRRALARSYLGKAYSEAGERTLAEKDFRLARDLDPGDPTAWLYSALHQWQQNRPNAAVRELEQSTALNDNRELFRSRLLLDRDRAVRSANLAALHRDAGVPEAGLRAAARAVQDDYANFAGHLYLANSYQAMADPSGFDLRYESARLSELLVANLLAPAGAGQLSQLLSPQERLRLFEGRPVGGSSLTEYRSSGDWRQEATVFGAVDGFGYAVDLSYLSQHGEAVADHREQLATSAQFQLRLGERDDLYFQTGFSTGEAGDVARHYDPADAQRGLRVQEEQLPNHFLGWHRAWTPASHTLVLFSQLRDTLDLRQPSVAVPFLRYSGGTVTSVSTPPGFGSRFASEFTLYSAELQQLWQGERQTIVAGGRFQAGEVDSEATLQRDLTGVVSQDHVVEPLRRANGYLYYHLQVLEPLRLIAGVSYDHLEYPLNSELSPLTPGSASRDLWAPKAGLVWTPWSGGLARAAYTRSLGGLFFDNSVRLEPAQVAGFTQAYRSLIPESVAGLVPGTIFDVASIGFDQSLPSGTYLGAGAEWLASDGARTVGALTNSLPLPLPDSPSSVRQTLDYRERGVTAYAAQLLGDGWTAGARYRLAESRLDTRLPGVPDTAGGLDSIEQRERAVFHQVTLSLQYQHPAGPFGRWESGWQHQHNGGYTPDRPVEDFWQHDLWVGYRPPRRAFEVRAGVLNLFDTDYRLNPLSPYQALPRGRTAVLSLRLNF